MDLTVTVHAERGSLWSEVSELPGCFASGRTVDELRDALAEAVRRIERACARLATAHKGARQEAVG